MLGRFPIQNGTMATKQTANPAGLKAGEPQSLHSDISDSDLQWLVANRSACQDFLMMLHTLRRSSKVQETKFNRAVPGALLGIGFSLWRAVFLIVTADSEKMDKAGQAFLTTLIADNMIAYAQDKTSSAWTAGYYINNALYRLHHIYSERLSDIKTRYGKPVEHQVNFQTALDIVDDRNELKRIWVLALNAAQEIFTIL